MNNFYDSGVYAPSYGSSINDAIGGMNSLSGVGGIALIILLLLCGVALLLLVALCIYTYVFTSLSLQKIASRRNYSKPWIAWIPILGIWLLGKLASDYDLQNGKKTHQGRNLLIFYFTYVSICNIGYCLYGITYFSPDPDLGVLLIGLLMFLLALVFAVVYSVITYICYYKIFKSTAGDNAIVYFLISLFVPIAQPLCLFLCRNKGYPYIVEEPKNII